MNVDGGKPWFVPKQYGYGAYPSSWEGWAVVLAFILADAALVWFVLARPALAGAEIGFGRIASFLASIAILVVVLIVVSKAKTDGSWEWRSGDSR